jgi:hypothetical protein
MTACTCSSVKSAVTDVERNPFLRKPFAKCHGTLSTRIGYRDLEANVFPHLEGCKCVDLPFEFHGGESNPLPRMGELMRVKCALAGLVAARNAALRLAGFGACGPPSAGAGQGGACGQI